MYVNENDKDCERRRVVKDFCFPDGVEVKLMKKKGERLSDRELQAFQKILYQSKNIRDCCFVFTMNANDENP